MSAEHLAAARFADPIQHTSFWGALVGTVGLATPLVTAIGVGSGALMEASGMNEAIDDGVQFYGSDIGHVINLNPT